VKALVTLLLICATLALTPVTALAQAPADSTLYRSSPVLIKYGKWVLLAAALGMGYQAAQSHNHAEDAFGRLEDYCFADSNRCDRGSGGKYSDPHSESLYQNALSHDRKSRGWLIGGELSLLSAAGMFVWELSRPKRPNPNIPFEPTVGFRGARTEFGIRFGF
jgi:hypothetical protein